jgi:hypothetical protein
MSLTTPATAREPSPPRRTPSAKGANGASSSRTGPGRNVRDESAADVGADVDVCKKAEAATMHNSHEKDIATAAEKSCDSQQRLKKGNNDQCYTAFVSNLIGVHVLR